MSSPTSAASPAGANRPHETLGLKEAIAIIVGIVIGAGIFKAPSLVATFSGSEGWMFAAWIAGGLISLIGALCYAELATAYPNAGGDYHFLHRAYGRGVSFLFGWARFSVITTGSIALLAFVFGDYTAQLAPLGTGHDSALYAGAAILALTWINVRGMRAGAMAQTWMTAVEVAGLLLIIVAGLFLVSNGNAVAPAAAPAAAGASSSGIPPMIGLAMVFVLLTFGGWNEAAYISAELKDERRNMVRALVWSIVLITVLYLLVVWAYWHGLGLQGMAKSKAVAADLLKVAFGPVGEKLMSVLVAVAALTSINATIIVGARTNYALGRDWPVLGRLGEWDERREAPIVALYVQSLAALVLVLIGATASLGGGFKAMVEFTAPVFWLFFLLSGISLFVLRRREPDAERPFQLPQYPLTPLLFCATCAYMLWSSLNYVYSKELGGLNAAWIGVLVLAVGGLILAFMPRQHAAAPDRP
ncbi:MAG: APC family permease [Rubrivivax sp.]